MTVIAIKANKTGAYNNVLSDTAKNFIKKRMLDSIWYPYEIYKECVNALCRVEAKDNPKIIQEWGKQFGKLLMTTIYKLSIVKGDVKGSIEKFQRFHKMSYNFSEMLVEFPSDNQLIIHYTEIEPDFKNYYYFAFGWLENFIELIIDKKPTIEILKKSWEGADMTQFKLSWSS